MATSTTKAAPRGEAAKTSTYEVISPLNHDLVAYAIGDEVELTAAEAAPLLQHTVKAKPGNG